MGAIAKTPLTKREAKPIDVGVAEVMGTKTIDSLFP
jgi:hypothetical protein